MTSLIVPAPDVDRPITDAGTELFDECYEWIEAGALAPAMDALIDGLLALRGGYPSEQWRQFAQFDWLHHPIREIAHADPMTRRAFLKPRGHPGDAGLLDLMCRLVPLPRDATPTGRLVYDVTTGRAACEGVRARRAALARAVDDTAARVPGARVLSMACGHLREAQISEAVAAGAVADYFAVDEDRDALAHVNRAMRGRGVSTICESVRGLVTGRVALAGLDLAYAAGLHDRLGPAVATAVTRAMLAMLNPGGRLLVANFAPSLRDIGYMESFMAWNLVYRDEQAMRQIAAGLPQDEIASARVYREADGHTVYLELVKA